MVGAVRRHQRQSQSGNCWATAHFCLAHSNSTHQRLRVAWVLSRPTSSSVTLAAFSVSHRQRMQMGLGRRGSGAHSHFSVGTGGSRAARPGRKRGGQPNDK